MRVVNYCNRFPVPAATAFKKYLESVLEWNFAYFHSFNPFWLNTNPVPSQRINTPTSLFQLLKVYTSSNTTFFPVLPMGSYGGSAVLDRRVSTRGQTTQPTAPVCRAHELWAYKFFPTIAPHTWYRIKGCVVQRGITNVGLEPSWCVPNSGYRKPPAPFVIPSYGSN